MPSLDDLPDEMLMEVVRSYDTIRSYKTQSTAFQNKSQEKDRQLENNTRQKALSSLCLTSHRMRSIALPVLYASSLTCATWRGLEQLQLFHRTISSPHNACAQSRRLAEYLQYVENRLADYLGNSLQDDAFYESRSSSRYFRLLSDVVLCAPNVQHLCVVSIEHQGVSFWNHLLVHWNTYSSMNILGHGLLNLKHLCVQIHVHSMTPEAALWERIALTLGSLHGLTTLCFSGATTNPDEIEISPLRDLSSIQRIELTECSLRFCELSHLLLACRGLRHFTCRWTFLDHTMYEPSCLRPGLLLQGASLESLVLDMRETRPYRSDEAGEELLGSLKFLTRLKFLEISDVGFLRHKPLLESPEQTLDHEISALLPSSIETLRLLIADEYDEYDDHDTSIDDAACLYQLAYDCKICLPLLNAVHLSNRDDMIAPRLSQEFSKEGLQLYLEKDYTW